MAKLSDAAQKRGGSRWRWTTLAAMTLANSMILIDQTSVPLAIPEVINGVGGRLSESQWVMTANILLNRVLLDLHA